MKKILVTKTSDLRLAPADPFSQEIINGMHPQKVYNVEVKEDRSNGELRLYFAGLAFLRESAFSEDDDKRWPETRDLHETLLIENGFAKKLWRRDHDAPGGYSFRFVPESVALESMEPDRFKLYFEKAKAWVWDGWQVDPWAEWIISKGGTP